jgi:hypothetical protein
MKAPRSSWVTLPLTTLWTEQGPLDATRVRALDHGDVLALLNAGPVHFVVAERRRPLRWIAKADAFQFWQTEVRDALRSPETGDAPTAKPPKGSYAASEWSAPAYTPHPIIVLERQR